MKYTINGKPAYLVAKDKGMCVQTFYKRLERMSVQDAIYTGNLRQRRKYVIRIGRQVMKTCFSTRQVAEYFGMSKGAICGLFFRQGDRITIKGCTCIRYKGGESETAKGL